MLNFLAIKLIVFYQKFISPYKGFSCAHKIATQEISCSSYGKRVIQRCGILIGYKLLNRRFYDCTWHAKNLQKITTENQQNEYKIYRQVKGYQLSQGGFIDCDIPSCDMPDCDMPNFKKCVPNCSLNILDACDFIPDSCNKKTKHSASFKKKRDLKNSASFEKNNTSKKIKIKKLFL